MDKEIFERELIEIEKYIYEAKGLPKGKYDSHAILYDKLVSNSLYNKIMWGNSPKEYTDFCRKGYASKGNVIADMGCGTLGFTSNVYAKNNTKKLFLCDLSFEMLKIGKKRLERISSDLSKIIFLRSDALNTPFKDNVIDNVLSFGVFHIFDSPFIFIKEILRILKPKGKLFLSSLCTDRKLSEKYLNVLYKKKHVSKPLKSSEIVSIIEKNQIVITEKTVIGGMVYLIGEKRE